MSEVGPSTEFRAPELDSLEPLTHVRLIPQILRYSPDATIDGGIATAELPNMHVLLEVARLLDRNLAYDLRAKIEARLDVVALEISGG